MKKSQPIQSALKRSDLIVREYVKALELENAKLQRDIAHLQAKYTSAQNIVAAQKKHIKKLETSDKNVMANVAKVLSQGKQGA